MRPSRKHVARAAAALLVTLISASPSGAQDSSHATLDSVLAQLRRAEARIDALEKERADDQSSAVRTKSGARLDFSGRILVNGFYDTQRVNNVDDPQFVRPDTTAGVPVHGLGMSPRQSVLNMAVLVPDVAGGRFTGDLSVDFYGGQQPSSGGRTFPLLRLRTMEATLDWSNGQLMVGQESPLISPLNPMSIAAIGTPDFAAAGNLWLWLPQVRATVQTHGSTVVGLQGAVLAPTSGDPQTAFDTDFDPAELSGRPYLESRLFLKWNANDNPGELGCGGHLGWVAVDSGAAPGGGSLVQSNALACDMHTPISQWLDVRGEAYTGQALRGLGGGGIAQELGPGNVAIQDKGAWGQLNVRPLALWGFGGGCGVDQPDAADLPVGGRQRNQACAAYITAHPVGPLLVGIEARQITTTYATGKLTNNHFNIGFGFEY